MKPDEIRKLEAFFKRTFKGAELKVRPMAKQKDTAEVYLDDEFLGTIGKDTDEGELSYHFTMSILDIDLD